MTHVYDNTKLVFSGDVQGAYNYVRRVAREALRFDLRIVDGSTRYTSGQFLIERFDLWGGA